jgi:ribose/xylose/arabinose/galactoside ABC-type transport system permease subunit
MFTSRKPQPDITPTHRTVIRTGAQQYGILIVLVVILIVLLALRPEVLSLENVYNVIRRFTVLGILAAGMTFVIASGGIDLSVGSILAFTGVIASIMMNRCHLSALFSTIAALLTAFALGAANGFLSCQLKYRSFIVTLGSMYIIRGATLMLTDGVAVWPLPSAFVRINDLAIGKIPLVTFLLVLVYFASHLTLTKTYFGRQVFTIGENHALARTSGVNVDLVVVVTLGISGLLAGFAGVITAASLISGQPMVGQGYELEAIAACVVGGASLSGGRWSVWSTLAGVLVLSVLRNAFGILGVSSYLQMMAVGAIVIGSLAIDNLRK